MSRTRSGAVTSQGDFVQHSDVLRSANSLTGAGVTVGVLSDSFDCYSVYAANHVSASGAAGYANNGFLATAATDVSTGDLPSGVNVLEEAEDGNGGCMNYGAPTQLPFTDEGRAMLQIVHDVAPGASLAFYTAENSEADFANGIGQLAASVESGGAGAKVIVDDVGYFDEPFYQDGVVAQAIDAVVAQGVAYFSAAGNDGTLAYDNDTPKLFHGVDHGTERRRAFAEFRCVRRHDSDVLAGDHRFPDSRRIRRHRGRVGSTLCHRRARQRRCDQSHRRVHHGRIRH